MFENAESLCGIAADKLPFELFGLCLQEPMALITNWLIASTSFILFARISKPTTLFQKHWRMFYLMFGISTVFGGLGHLLFYYFDVFGKFPCWVFGFIAAFHAGKAMISNKMISETRQKRLTQFLLFKMLVLGGMAVLMGSFIYVMIDASITYLFFCLGFGMYYWKNGNDGFKYTVIAVLVLLPSIFIFTLQINPHIWFNKDDLSHILMVTTIIFFYFGIIRNREEVNEVLEITNREIKNAKKQFSKHN
jgi:hypothetical protein